LTVSTELPAPGIELGEKVAVLPDGKPVIASATLPLNPPTAVVESV
jgi:hypothetical protein